MPSNKKKKVTSRSNSKKNNNKKKKCDGTDRGVAFNLLSSYRTTLYQLPLLPTEPLESGVAEQLFRVLREVKPPEVAFQAVAFNVAAWNRRTTTQHHFTEESLRISMGVVQKLYHYPMSNYFVIGSNLCTAERSHDSVKAFKQGAESVGCVWCMYVYAKINEISGRIHEASPYYLECAIRGHAHSIDFLVRSCYNHLTHTTNGLDNFWTKIAIDLDPSCRTTQDKRKEMKDRLCSICNMCGTSKLPEHHLCAGCRCYSYCCRSCQRHDWKDNNHRGECRQLKILKRYFRNHAGNIRDAITSGVDPKKIKELQAVRRELGLNRPKEEYKDLLRVLDDDDTKDKTKSLNRHKYLTGRPKDGTVHIGSTPNLI